MHTSPGDRTFFQRNPLVAAAALFLPGVSLGKVLPLSAGVPLAVAAVGLLLWLLAERSRRAGCATAALAIILFAAGAALWPLDQRHLPADHIARFADRQERILTLRARVITAPESATAHGNRYWLARADSLWNGHAWIPASGDLMVQWTGGDGPQLSRGMQVELSGWLSLPDPALNPGAYDARAALAADRVFAQVRIPRPSGVTVLDPSTSPSTGWLSSLRLALRARLLEHTLPRDVPAAYTLSALLLGYRDPAIADVAQSFADAGIAHLLAISGSHIVFFTALAWTVLRFLPLRPRRRELLILAVVGLYILATPCNPPILRAAIALLMLVASRLSARPPQYLNMLAGAAILIVLLRPVDLFDAGFQLSFASTAALLVFSTRVHAALFGRMLARAQLAADLSRTRGHRLRARALKVLSAALTANLIGALTAAPLVALYFGQVNLWAVFTGILALPVVSLTMIVAALQLLAALAGVGAWFAPLAALSGRAMIWLVARLAAIPGAAVALRPPPWWLVLCIYALFLLWALRRRLGLSRAHLCNAALACAATVAAWYAFSASAHPATLTVLHAGTSDCILLETPAGLWAIDAGAPQGSSLTHSALRPALLLAGARRIDGQIVTALAPAHAMEAGLVADTCLPRQIWVSAAQWPLRGQTLQGAQLASAAQRREIPVHTFRAGESLDLAGCRVQALWPPADAAPAMDDTALVLLVSAAGQHVLIADPHGLAALAMIGQLPLSCDTILFTGAQRGAADAEVLRLVAPLHPREIIWCGRGPWADPVPSPGTRNTADSAVIIPLPAR